ncbi:hypothetical protein KPL74_05900 [Bacillus sp. NP157]|nr:hypothetical protein KPL74_05900 [Bacillus sp. NP157]
MLQLNPPLPLNTPKGEGFAHFLIDYGPESDLYWTVFITETGEIWTFANREVRASKNITLGRTAPSVPGLPRARPAEPTRRDPAIVALAKEGARAKEGAS